MKTVIRVERKTWETRRVLECEETEPWESGLCKSKGVVRRGCGAGASCKGVTEVLRVRV